MLVSLADMKTYLGETGTTYDDFLTAQLNLYSAAIEGYCSRIFNSTMYTQTIYPENMEDLSSKIYLYHFPVVSVTSMSVIKSVDGVDTETTVLNNYEYRVNKTDGSLIRIDGGYPLSWKSLVPYGARLAVNYTAGYAVIPLEIDAVVKRLVETDYSKKKSGVSLNLGPDVQSIAIPGVMNIAYDYSLQANERKTKYGMLIGNFTNVLDAFRSERALIGEVKEYYVS